MRNLLYLTSKSLIRGLSLCVLGILTCFVANAQSLTDGSTPLAISPGAPEGSYALSDLDTVNLYNGSLSFRLPIAKIAGRGGSGYTMVARIEHKWLVEKDQELGVPNRYIPNPNWWNADGFSVLYSVGRLEMRQAVSNEEPFIACGAYIYHETLSRLTFTAPDGTEYELRDQLTNGRPDHPTCTDGLNRGRVFTTSDGSNVVFTSDSDIVDSPGGPNNDVFVSGYLVTRDGTRYRVDNSLVTWMRDRNGNKITFSYDVYLRLASVTDSLNRQITISYANEAFDQITLKGFGGAARTIKVYQSQLRNALRSDFSELGYPYLFPELNGAGTPGYIPVVSAVELPNGQQYHFYYNSFAELARVVLPTGGAMEYDYAAGLTDGAADGVINIQSPYPGKEIYRRIIERRIYPDGGSGSNFATRMTYSRPETTTSNAGYVVADQFDANGTRLNRSQHYFYGSPRASFSQQPTQYSGWQDGREYQTTVYAADGTTALRQVTNTFSQRAAVSWWTGSAAQEPPNDPRLVETDSTLVDTNQVSKQTFGYDDSVPFNNQNNVKEYDFGSGSAGSLVRETRTTFITSSSYTADVSLPSLPSQVSVYDGSGVERSRSTFEYDNYATDTNHAGLVSRSNICGFDSGFGTSYGTRGNVTGSTHYLLNSSGSVTGSVTSYAQYDIAGNVVKTIDARGNPTTADFTDRFGVPDGEARNNSGAAELGGQASYAFPTLVTNAANHTVYTQYDYYLGRPVDAEDANGIVSTGYYNDALDRPSQLIRANNGGADTRSQVTFAYDDTNHIITSTSDQAIYNDNVLESQTLYDGLGRTTEKRQYEGGGNYIAVEVQYDALGRAYKTSNPFRPWQSETAVWTTSAFDALGRMTSVTTPDSAVVTTSYSGNTVTVTDQAGKQRKSVTDGLGRLIQMYEDPNGLNYLTSYSYDTLDDLTAVFQGSQTRSFVYDSLKRLSSATNPESGTVSYQYDNNGNLTTKTDARAITSTYAYDALNRATTRSYSDGTPAVTYNYDSTTITNGKGRLASVSSSVSTYSYSGYDALGRVLGGSETIGAQTYTMGYNYDLAGHMTSMSYPSGRTVSYGYDAAGRTNSFTGRLGDGALRTYSTGISYSPLGGMAQEQFGTTIPIYNKLFYNSRGQLAEIREGLTPNNTSWQRGAIINFYSSCWGMCGGSNSTTPMPNNNGNLKIQQVFIPQTDAADYEQHYDVSTQFFEYDSLNRLQFANEASWKQQYSYDRYGNRTIDQGNTFGVGIPNPYFGVDQSTNRLTPAGGYTMHYDAAGNLDNDNYTGQGQRNFDAENRMTAASSNGQWQSYVYDADGRRVKRVVNGAETWQVYGIGGELIAEYAVNGNPLSPQKEYGYRNGQLLITATMTAGGWGPAPPFNDNPLQAGVTTAQARHITELQTAINAVRSHYNLSAYSWQYSATTNDYISANPILEMRTALDQALGTPSGGYAGGLASGQPIKAIHIQELRDRILAAWQNGSGGVDLRWMVTDQLSTPRMIFDQSGSLATTSRHDYLPFGEELGAGIGGRTQQQGYSASDGVRQHFSQKERDNETGLDYFGARYYSSQQGRFTSVDPSRKSILPLNPQSWNRYSYTYNNPLALVDENGKWPTRIHNLIIDNALRGLDADLRGTIKAGSYSVDDPLSGGQNKSHANEHGMAKPGQSVEQAAEGADQFINTNVDAAKCRKTCTQFDKLFDFGRALHTVQDMTSPAHEGYQMYDKSVFAPWNGVDTGIHMGTEWNISNFRMGLAIGATLSLYRYTFGQEALQHATGYTPGSENDPTLKEIRSQYALPGSNALAEGEAVYEYRMGLQEGLRFNWHDQWGRRGRRKDEPR